MIAPTDPAGIPETFASAVHAAARGVLDQVCGEVLTRELWGELCKRMDVAVCEAGADFSVQAWFDPEQNGPNDILDGRLTIYFSFAGPITLRPALSETPR